MTLHLATIASKLDISECAQIWHIANKFQKHQVHFHIALDQDPNSHFLNSLVFKLGCERNQINHDLNFDIYFAKQIYDTTGSKENLHKAFVEFFLKNHKQVDYVVFIDQDTLFSQTPTPTIWEFIYQKANWYAGGGKVYGKQLNIAPAHTSGPIGPTGWMQLINESTINPTLLNNTRTVVNENWTYLQEYPMIDSLDNYDESQVKIGIFEKKLQDSTNYRSWKNFIENNYLQGRNLFHWEKKYGTR